MVLSRGSSANPCDRRIPIFDGKERFDLVFSHKGEMKVTEQQPSGQPGIAHVCRVKYLPIAGHKVDSETRFMAANNEIEVALRPIPSANVFMPYQITIPTMAGSATIVSKRVEIESARQAADRAAALSEPIGCQTLRVDTVAPTLDVLPAHAALAMMSDPEGLTLT